MVHEIPKNKKRRNFSQNIRSNKLPDIKPPENQDFAGGITIEFTQCEFSTRTGRRDREIRIINGRFPHTERGVENLALFFENNCGAKHLKDLNGDNYGNPSYSKRNNWDLKRTS